MSKADELSQLANQAAELVSNLEALKQRIGHYGAARDELRSANERIAELTAELQRLAGKTHDVLQKLDENDVAKLAARVSEVDSKLGMVIEQQAATNRLVILGVILSLLVLGLTVKQVFW